MKRYGLILILFFTAVALTLFFVAARTPPGPPDLDLAFSKHIVKSSQETFVLGGVKYQSEYLNLDINPGDAAKVLSSLGYQGDLGSVGGAFTFPRHPSNEVFVQQLDVNPPPGPNCVLTLDDRADDAPGFITRARQWLRNWAP